MSDSSSDGEENGITLQLPRLAGVYRHRHPRPLIESDGTNLEPDSVIRPNDITQPKGSKRQRLLSNASSDQSPTQSTSSHGGTINMETAQDHVANLRQKSTSSPAPQSSRTRTNSSSSVVSATSFSAAPNKLKRKVKSKKRRTSLKKRNRTLVRRASRSGVRKKLVRKRSRRLTLPQRKIKKVISANFPFVFLSFLDYFGS